MRLLLYLYSMSGVNLSSQNSVEISPSSRSSSFFPCHVMRTDIDANFTPTQIPVEDKAPTTEVDPVVRAGKLLSTALQCDHWKH
jgi:hypothetical protein